MVKFPNVAKADACNVVLNQSVFRFHNTKNALKNLWNSALFSGWFYTELSSEQNEMLWRKFGRKVDCSPQVKLLLMHMDNFLVVWGLGELFLDCVPSGNTSSGPPLVLEIIDKTASLSLCKRIKLCTWCLYCSGKENYKQDGYWGWPMVPLHPRGIQVGEPKDGFVSFFCACDRAHEFVGKNLGYLEIIVHSLSQSVCLHGGLHLESIILWNACSNFS